MKIAHLKLTNFRVFEQAEFNFQAGMNLIVGINGAGKSTVLDALRIALSRVLPEFTACEEKRIKFSANDITIGHDKLAVEFELQAFGSSFKFNVSRGNKHEVEIQRKDRQILESKKTAENQPIVVYFSTRRSIPTEASVNPNRSSGNQSAAFADALIHRMLRLPEFTNWWLVQEELLGENSELAQKRLNVLHEAVKHFLDSYTNLRVVRTSQTSTKTTLLLDKDGMTFNVNQLSDGERGILALVLDLVQRLLQANPDLEDPLQNGKAVVLIDELDLHLHPRWQRTIVQKLTRTFPNCQFIATTHSPQIIGEVLPGNIIILRNDQEPKQAYQSFGMDSNWILRALMEDPGRDPTIVQNLEQIANLIEDEEYDEAINKIDALREKIGEFPELVRLQTRIDRLQLLEDE